MTNRPRKLLDQVRVTMRRRHYAPRTEDAYCHWIRRYILFHDKQHPRELGVPEVEAFLAHLAVERHLAASTLNQALSALLLLYRQVFDIELPPIRLAQSRRSPRLPTVLMVGEVQAIIESLSGTPRLVVQLLYGSGLRIGECVRLRVKDVVSLPPLSRPQMGRFKMDQTDSNSGSLTFNSEIDVGGRAIAQALERPVVVVALEVVVQTGSQGDFELELGIMLAAFSRHFVPPQAFGL